MALCVRRTIPTLAGRAPAGGFPINAVTAEIKTGRRRVISYLLSPLRRYAYEGIRER
jgi:hypothetical protein